METHTVQYFLYSRRAHMHFFRNLTDWFSFIYMSDKNFLSFLSVLVLSRTSGRTRQLTLCRAYDYFNAFTVYG